MKGPVGDELMEAPTVIVEELTVKTVIVVTMLLMRRKRNVWHVS